MTNATTHPRKDNMSKIEPKHSEDTRKGLRCKFLQRDTAFFHKVDGDFHTVVSWFLKQQGKNLERNHFTTHELVDKVGKERRGRDEEGLESKIKIKYETWAKKAAHLLISKVGLFPLCYQSHTNQLTDIRKFGIDDRD